MFIIILCLCIPLAIPNLLLSYKLIQKKFLGTLFNKSITVIFILIGKINIDLKSNSFLFIETSLPGLSTPMTLTLYLNLLMNTPDDSALFCGILISLRIIYGQFMLGGLFVSLFYRYASKNI